ncbi:MAG: 2-oxo acid dehydrogenase subunit E2 [Thermoanaerobacteraceae bacterium]|nr:2-oxo acid dehydrogenase subunit E2 [Thermoanaerobacteraceae bacterium]
MATTVKMPKVGLSEESSIISKWHKKKGDTVAVGDLLFTIETDKTTFDVEAETGGSLLEIFFHEGDEVPVLTDVCVIGNPGDDITDFIPKQQTSSEVQKIEKTEEPRNVVENEKADTAGKEIFGKLKISPRAKKLAEKSGVGIKSAVGTGPDGRIIERDIIELIEKGPIFTPAAMEESKNEKSALNLTSGSGLGGRITTKDLVDIPVEEKQQKEQFTEIQLSNVRKIIAKNMLESLTNTAQLTLNTSFDATEILSYRQKIKQNRDKSSLCDISLNDMILFAVSRTLPDYKTLNAHLIDDKMLIFDNVNLGVAVDTDRGLMVPTVFWADTMSLNQISETFEELVKQCRTGNINPDFLKGGTFTVTNLGSLGVESFTPILNPPQVAILGVNSVTYKVKPVDGEYTYYPSMGLSLTFDHRAVDGAPAARFLKQLVNNLENFNLLLAK